MISNCPEWQALANHQTAISQIHLSKLFQDDQTRFTQYSLEAANLFLDYSKNHINNQTLELLFELAHAAKVKEAIAAMFRGDIINTSEQRAAYHVALRSITPPQNFSVHSTIQQNVLNVLNKMALFVGQVHNGEGLGSAGKPITDIINIGIGGSDTGPAFVCDALTSYQCSQIRLHFISNIDGGPLETTLNQLNPETSLFIISSKSFTTQETLVNAQTIRSWLQQKLGDSWLHHCIAVTQNVEQAIKFGIPTENIFPVWEWVGGRYSVWSATGLPIALAIGYDNFTEFLAGAHDMDEHFYTAPLAQNMPVILGLLGIWYNNFFQTHAHAILPYDAALTSLPMYLQQMEMESNGKRVTHLGQTVNYQTAPISFGGPGTNAQHSFYQLLHQGTKLIPVDFIVPLQSHHSLHQHHTILIAHAFSQSKALMEGQTAEGIRQEMRNKYTEEEIQRLTPHKILPGNRPSNTLLLPKLTPRTLGALLALYEHKVFVQSVIWQINAFDQWGVEWSKQLANQILNNILDSNIPTNYDHSTNGLLMRYHKNRTSRT